MDYVLRGNEKDVANVLKEQRIRIARGVVSFTPLSECGLMTEEDVLRILEDRLAEKNNEISELTASITEKDKSITELTNECNAMKTRITELESCIADTKELPAEDSKEIIIDESGCMEIDANTFADNKDVVLEDQKKVGRPKKSK